ncbi:metal ABC transporter permease [Escherichia coli]
MSHAVFPGISRLPGFWGYLWLQGHSLPEYSARWLTGYLKDNSRIKQDTVMGIVFSGMFAAGLILYIAVKPD